jgi:hypothetical protein
VNEIRISPRASVTERFAADELASYLNQITARKWPVRVESLKSPPTPTAAFYVCNFKNLIFPAPAVSIVMPAGPEAFTIIPTESGTALIGNSDAAVLTAVYRYLDAQGCRFLSPEFDFYHGSAEIIPKHALIPLKKSITGQPRLKFRKLYVEEGHSHTTDNLKQLIEWMPKAGYNTLVVPTNYQGHGKVKWDNWREALTPQLQKRGITIEVGGHGYQNFIASNMEGGKLFDEHPDWFAADENGKRQKTQNWVFCTSNAQARQYLIDNFITYIEAHPEIQIYDFWPPDGARWCECDNCKKLGTPSDRQAILLKQVEQAVHAKIRRPPPQPSPGVPGEGETRSVSGEGEKSGLPGEGEKDPVPREGELRLEMIAYSSYLQPPEHEKIDKSVLVDFCPISQHFDAQIGDPSCDKNKLYADALLAWRKSFAGDISIYSYYRKYAWDSLPLVMPHYLQKDLQWYAKVPVQGVSIYSEPADWGTYELNHYVLAALAWDPDCDVDALIKKFCDARYGDRSDLAQQALAVLGKNVRTYCAVPNVPMKSAEAIESARAQVQEQANAIAAALTKSSAKGLPLRGGLTRLQLMCQYASRDLEIQHLRATHTPKSQIIAKITDLQKWLASHAADGDFLVKDQRLSLSSLLRRYKMPAP